MSEPQPIDWADLDGPEPLDTEVAPWDDSSADSAGTDGTDALTAADADAASAPAAAITGSDLRSRVLAHPDLAARLCDPPLRYSRPDAWTGYVPPDTWQGRHNDSTRRLQLIGIIAELEGREAAG